MKKLLVLMLVLGMASLANAALVLSIYVDGVEAGSAASVDIGDTITIDVYSNEEGSYDAYLAMSSGLEYADWAGITMYDLTPGVSIAANTYYAGALAGFDTYLLNNSTFDIENQPAAGIAFSLSFLGVAEGTVDVKLDHDVWGSTVDTLAVTVIPEPMTLALLGLGGLFLRRKK